MTMQIIDLRALAIATLPPLAARFGQVLAGAIRLAASAGLAPSWPLTPTRRQAATRKAASRLDCLASLETGEMKESSNNV